MLAGSSSRGREMAAGWKTGTYVDGQEWRRRQDEGTKRLERIGQMADGQ